MTFEETWAMVFQPGMGEAFTLGFILGVSSL